MEIIDSQVHIWGADTPERPWPGRGKVQRAEPVGKDEMLDEMNRAGVAGCIIVPPTWEGDRNDLGLAAAEAHPNRFGVMGRLNLADPASRPLIPTWRSQPGMLGLRLTFTQPGMVEQLTNGIADWIWPAAEKADMPLYVYIRQNMSHHIDAIAAKHPGLKLCIDHLGIAPEGRDEGAFADFDQLLALHRRPNVAVKVSALPCYSTEPWPHPRLHPFVRRVYDTFGPQRMFWGSDWSRLRGTYHECVTMFTEGMPWIPEEDLEWIMGRGVRQWLRWRV